MATNFERSALRVLEQFLQGARTEDDLYRYLDEDVFELSLRGATLRQFLSALAAEGYLVQESNGYLLAGKGRDEINRLTRIIKDGVRPEALNRAS